VVEKMINSTTFIIAFIGSLLAAIEDLKTTEIPDEIPFMMSTLGVFYWYIYSLNIGGFQPLLLSLATGLVLLAFGWLLYLGGQWGGGDAKVLAGIGFLMPFYSWFTMGMVSLYVTFVINLFLVGSAYMIFYTLVIGFIDKKVFPAFVKSVRGDIKIVFGIPIISLMVVVLILNTVGFIEPLMLMSTFLISLFITLFWKYAKTIEDVAFKRRIPVSKLREGDVLFESKKWIGLTKEEVRKIKKTRKSVVIKEGVRFAPAFPLALIITYYLGNILLFLVIQ